MRNERSMTPRQFALFMALLTWFAIWAFNCPSIHAQTVQATPQTTPAVITAPIRLEESPFLRRRAMGFTLYCMMLFDRTGATGVHLHDERLVSTFLVDWQPIGVQVVHEHVSGCGCEFQIVTPLPFWLVKSGAFLAWKVDRENGTFFVLTTEKILSWYVEPWR